VKIFYLLHFVPQTSLFNLFHVNCSTRDWLPDV
jgi:hypothetical protein